MELLYESEQTGVQTAEELARQREQLLGTEARLGDMRASLQQSDRHIRGMSGVLGSLVAAVGSFFTTGTCLPRPSGPSGGRPASAPAAAGTDTSTAPSASRSSVAAGGPSSAPPPGPGPGSLQGLSVSAALDVQLGENLGAMSASLARQTCQPCLIMSETCTINYASLRRNRQSLPTASLSAVLRA